jgi:DNA topoisomerase-1
VAVRLIVEREKEIRAFVPEEYWEIHADTRTRARDALRLEVAKHRGENFRPTNEAQTTEAVRALELADFEVVERKDKPTKTKPGAPYITSTLQQAASTRLGFSVKKTMMLAQRLYEAGHITYMRTDSTNLSRDAVEACRGAIARDFGARYLPGEPNVYSSKQGAQEAHEAIRPSDVEVRPGQLQGVERDQERLYELIWRQFVACQMAPAEYLSTNLAVKAGEYELRTRGRIIVFDGHTRAQPTSVRANEGETALPDVQVGERLDLVKLDPIQHFTKPPPRYGEASLVKELEKRGIGRPSTYASIISTIQDRGYVRLENRRFYAEKMGEIVTERLIENFGELMDYGFTAGLEQALDEVAVGNKQWKKVLGDFYDEFRQQLTAAEHPKKGMRANLPTETNIPCPQCGRPMQIRTASTGVFLGCSGYGLPPKERCKSTLNLIPGDEAVSIVSDEGGDEEGGDEVEARLLLQKRHCPICQTAMNSYLVDETRKLYVCGDNPDCPGYEVEAGSYQIKGYDGPVLECDRCGEDMQLKSGRFGKYFGCTSDVCKNTRKLLRSGEAAPPKVDPIPMPHLRCERCDDFFLLRDGAAGIFLAASQFPKHRETRAPTVAELVSVKDKLDPKYRYLADAPKTDPDGRPAVVRFARKTREQYVTSEVDGKATAWRAHYHDGRWVAEASGATERPVPRRVAARDVTPRKRVAARKSAGRKAAAGKQPTTKRAKS